MSHDHPLSYAFTQRLAQALAEMDAPFGVDLRKYEPSPESRAWHYAVVIKRQPWLVQTPSQLGRLRSCVEWQPRWFAAVADEFVSTLGSRAEFIDHIISLIKCSLPAMDEARADRTTRALLVACASHGWLVRRDVAGLVRDIVNLHRVESPLDLSPLLSDERNVDAVWRILSLSRNREHGRAWFRRVADVGMDHTMFHAPVCSETYYKDVLLYALRELEQTIGIHNLWARDGILKYFRNMASAGRLPESFRITEVLHKYAYDWLMWDALSAYIQMYPMQRLFYERALRPREHLRAEERERDRQRRLEERVWNDLMRHVDDEEDEEEEEDEEDEEDEE